MSEPEYLSNTPLYLLVEIEGISYYTTPNGKNDFSEEKAALLRIHTPVKTVAVKPKALPAPIEEPKPKRSKK